MKHKTFWKEVRRSVRHSMGRFLAIMGIVALGAGFLAGLSATQPVMERTADQYFEDTDYMDIKIQSTLGLTDDDIDALRQTEGVLDVMPSYMLDLITTVSGMEGEKVVRFSGMPENMNQLVLYEGRLPESDGECVVNRGKLSTGGVQVGDTLTVLEDGLKRREYTVVGLVNSAQYMSLTLGSTTKGSGSLSYVAYVPEDQFEQEVYTIAYVRAEAAQGLSAFSQEYDDCIDALVEQLESVGRRQAQLRYEDMLLEGEEELAKARQQYYDEKRRIEAELAAAQDQLADYEKKLQTGQQEVQRGEAAYDEGSSALKEGWASYEASWARFEENRSKTYASLEENQARLNVEAEKLTQARKQWMEAGAELTASKAELDAAETRLAEIKTVLDAATAELENQGNQLDAQYQALQAQKPMMSEEEYQAALQQWQEASDQFYQSQKELAEQLKSWQEQKQALAVKQAEYEAEQKSYAETGILLDEKEQQLEKSRQQLVSTREAAEKQLSAAEQQLISARQQLLENEEKLQQSQDSLQQGKDELSEAEEQLASGQQELEEAQTEAEQQLTQAWEQIEEGQQQLSDIPKAEWYVLDRDMDESFVSFAGDAERMGKIATVFPWMFFVVAALVSLTTMTRMVEEERQQIGVYKALGLGSGQILMKYLAYAGIASIVGAAAGIIIGFEVLPRAVCQAYRTMYMLPDTLIRYYPGKAAVAGGAALLCTLGATVAACLRCLKAKPAALMQPEAPKAGKRIFLEYIGPVWRHMSFIKKVTARNLFRYKKRLFMTIIGIAGCTGLLLTGFGLLDSVKDIVQNQFYQVYQYDGTLGVKDEVESRRAVENSSVIEDYLYVSSKTVDVTSDSNVISAYLFVPENEQDLTRMIRFQTRVEQTPVTFDENHIVLTEKLADRLGVSVGDIISIKDSSGMNTAFTVGGITENYLRNYVYMPRRYYEEKLGYELNFNEILFRLKTAPADAGNESGLSEDPGSQLREEMSGSDGIATVQLLDDMIEPVYKMIRSINLVVLVLIISAGLLAFIVLYNLININITERKREIATIKVLGFHPGEVSAYIFRETTVLTILGCLAGLLVGIAMHRFVITTVEVDMVMFGRSIHALSYLWAALITMGFSGIVDFVMHFKLRRIDMVESLKSVD